VAVKEEESQMMERDRRRHDHNIQKIDTGLKGRRSESGFVHNCRQVFRRLLPRSPTYKGFDTGEERTTEHRSQCSREFEPQFTANRTMAGGQIVHFA